MCLSVWFSLYLSSQAFIVLIETIHHFWKILTISYYCFCPILCPPCLQGLQLHIFVSSIIFHISLTLFPVFSILCLCEHKSISFWPTFQSTIPLFNYVLSGVKPTAEFLSSTAIFFSSRISIQLLVYLQFCKISLQIVI